MIDNLIINTHTQGLVVPILRDVQKMSFADVEKELNALAVKVCSKQWCIPYIPYRW